MNSLSGQSQNKSGLRDSPVTENSAPPRVLSTGRGFYYCVNTPRGDYKVKINMPHAHIFDDSFYLLGAVEDNNYNQLIDSVKKLCKKFSAKGARPLGFRRPSQLLVPQSPDRSLRVQKVSGYPEDCDYFAESYNNSYYELYHRPGDRDGNNLWRGTVSVTNKDGCLLYQQEIAAKPLSLGLLLRHCQEYEDKLRRKNQSLERD